MKNLIPLFCAWLFISSGQCQQLKNEIGPLRDSKGQNVGVVHLLNENQLLVKNFTPGNGTRLGVAFYVTDKNETVFIATISELGQEPNVVLNSPVSLQGARSLTVEGKQSEVLGSIAFPANLAIPKIRILPEFSRLDHDLRSGNITIVDSKTIRIPNLHYDGKAPAAYFYVWYGDQPNRNGHRIPDEDGQSTKTLKEYRGETIELKLPANLTVRDFDWLSMWCEKVQADFGHVKMPKDLVDIPLSVLEFTNSAPGKPIINQSVLIRLVAIAIFTKNLL